MVIRYFALAYGIVFLLVGAAGFVPALLGPYEHAGHALVVDAFAGDLLGLFPVNVLHNLTHLVFGLWGIFAWRDVNAARGYAKAAAVVYVILVLMGLIPGLSTVFGLVPLFGHDVWLHIVLAGIAAWFGFMANADDTAQ